MPDHASELPETGAGSLFAPSQRRKLIIGHQFVNADWIKLTATNPVNKNQYEL